MTIIQKRINKNQYIINIYDEEIMNDKSIKYYTYVLLLKELRRYK